MRTFSTAYLGAMLADAESANVPIIITGNFQKKDSIFFITSQIYQTSNGQILYETQKEGRDIFQIIDELSIDLMRNIGVPEHHLQSRKDLPIKTLMTDNLAALEKHVEGNYEAAERLDPTFAYNSYVKAEQYYFFQRGAREAKKTIERAMKHRSRVSEIFNLRIRTLYYNINRQNEKAIALREMQAELNPTDVDAYQNLFYEHYKNGNYEQALSAVQKIAELAPKFNQILLAKTIPLTLLNRYEEAAKILEDYVKKFPKDESGLQLLGEAYLDLGKTNEAEALFNKISLMNPEDKNMPLILAHIEYLKSHGNNYNPEKFKAFIGLYRYENSELEVAFTYSGGKLFCQAPNQTIGRMYPVSDTSFIAMVNARTTFMKNKQGEVYKQITIQDGHTNNVFKLDSTILIAEQLFDEEKKEAALSWFENAYAKNPEHNFLAKYIQHLKFSLSPAGQNEKTERSQYVGRYQVPEEIIITVTLENNQLYAQLPKRAKIELYPLDYDHYFSRLSGFQLMFHWDKQDKVTSLTYIKDGEQKGKKLD